MGAYVLYVSLQGGSVRIGVTGAPSVTAAFLTDGRTGVPAGEVVLVSSPLPLGVAEAVQRDVERTSWLARLRWPVAVRWALRRRLRRALASVGAKPVWRVVGGEGGRSGRAGRGRAAGCRAAARRPDPAGERSGPAAGNLRRGRALCASVRPHRRVGRLGPADPASGRSA